MASKKQHELFNKKAHGLLVRLGAKETGKEMYKYQLETKAGLLYITTRLESDLLEDNKENKAA